MHDFLRGKALVLAKKEMLNFIFWNTTPLNAAVCAYSSRQKAGVKGRSNEKISKRPASIRKEFIHKVASFKQLQEPKGPT